MAMAFEQIVTDARATVKEHRDKKLKEEFAKLQDLIAVDVGSWKKEHCEESQSSSQSCTQTNY
eukprot:3832897-Amphidinium_carterae.1